DYLNQAWGMQKNAFGRNGSSIHESDTGGYQTSYVHHLENPVRFTREIKVTIEHGHANHCRNEMSSTAYWYAKEPAAAVEVPPVEKRAPLMKNARGQWLFDPANQVTTQHVKLTPEMREMKRLFKQLFLCHEVNKTPRKQRDQQRVTHRDMIRHENSGAFDIQTLTVNDPGPPKKQNQRPQNIFHQNIKHGSLPFFPQSRGQMT
ncbi:MAG: DUF2961 domain-containing protein, partial [Clostridia bacterium]|nr:DUF2961 domain-containing protein [Clostridia bacterium]